MKRAVRAIAREQLLREYPIAGLVPGWFFRVEEISPSFYRAEGSDEYGRQVSCSGTAVEELLERCAEDALLVGAPTFIVKDHFDLMNVGLALTGEEPMNNLAGSGPWLALVRRPDRTLVRSIAHRPRFVYKVRPEVERIAITLPGLTKADVPIGSEVFLRRMSASRAAEPGAAGDVRPGIAPE